VVADPSEPYSSEPYSLQPWYSARAAALPCVPDLTLPSSRGEIELRTFCAKRAALYIYPATGIPGRDPAIDPAPGWDDIPGAAGCTRQCRGFRASFASFVERGIRVAGISGQSLSEQADFALREAIPFPLICDRELALQHAWQLPVFSAGGRTFLRRMVLYVAANQIERVLYPVADPGESANALLALLGSE
jgi:peroxiredoxin